MLFRSDCRVRFGEERFAVLHLIVPVTAPGGQETNEQPEGLRFVDNVVDVIPVVVGRAVLHGGPRWIEIDEREMPVGIRVVVTVEFGDGDGLNDREAFLRAVGEIFVCLFAIETVE